MMLTDFQTSKLRTVDLRINGTTLNVIRSNRSFDFSEIKKLEIAKIKKTETIIPFRIGISIFRFTGTSILKNIFFEDEQPKNKWKITINLLNGNQTIVLIDKNIDLISTSKVLKFINEEINESQD